MAETLIRPAEARDHGSTVNTPPWDRLASVGRIFFAASMIGFGAMSLLWQGFVTTMVPPWPAWVPGRSLWACLVGAVLIAIGAAILFQIEERLAAVALGTMLLLSAILLYGPRVAAKAGVLGVYFGPSECIALAGGAFLIARLSSENGRTAAGQISSARLAHRDRTLPARILFGGFLAFCGIEHFVYTDVVARLVPAWIPFHHFWTCFAGVALIAAGLGLVVEKTKRWAALLCGGMIFTWFLILHIPRALAAPHDAAEWSSVCESLAFSGMAFLLAATASTVRA